MRIVHLTQTTTADIAGGLEHHIAYLTQALRELGHNPIVVSTSALQDDESRAAGAGVAMKSEGSGFSLLRRLVPPTGRSHVDGCLDTLDTLTRRLSHNRHTERIAEHVERLKPDLVHQHSYLDGLALNGRLGKQYPLVFTNHTGAYLHLDRHGPTRVLQRQMMKRFSAVIGPSRELLPATRNSYYIPNGVDTVCFQPVPEEERRRLIRKWDCTGKQVFFCPRRWAPTKGIIYLAHAVRCITEKTREGSVFLFAGNETPGYEQYQASVTRALEKAGGCNVRMLGNLEHGEMVELLNIASACVVPSLMEATSLTCLESMACGTPVLGSETGGLVELIEEGVNGWFVPMRDVKALASKIDEIAILGEGERTRLRARTLQSVVERYTWRIAALETEKVYRRVLQDWLLRRRSEWACRPFGSYEL